MPFDGMVYEEDDEDNVSVKFVRIKSQMEKQTLCLASRIIKKFAEELSGWRDTS